jgi:cytidylate kinase
MSGGVETTRSGLVVAISGTTGSGARELGRTVACELSCHYLDKEILLAAAERFARIKGPWSEQDVQFLRECLVPAKPPGRPAGLKPVAGPLLLSVDDQAYLPVQVAIIRAAAAWGPMVIVGRAGRWILRDQEPLLSIRIDAPRRARACRIRRMYSLKSEDIAERLVSYCDQRSETFIWRVAGRHVDCLSGYDLFVDTSEVGFDGALAIIRHAIEPMLPRNGRRASPIGFPSTLAS